MPATATVSRQVAFARGLIAFGWPALAVLGPMALFLTWWGDCFEAVCPAPSDFDRAVYRFDVVAWVLLGGLGLLVMRWPRAVWFFMIGAIGLAFSVQGFASLLGVRAFYAFVVILPVVVLLIAASVVGALNTFGRSVRWLPTSSWAGAGIGCGTYVIGYIALVGGAAFAAGHVLGLVLLVLIAVVIVLVAQIGRRRSA